MGQQSANDWENPKLLERNREPAHATLWPYPDVAKFPQCGGGNPLKYSI